MARRVFIVDDETSIADTLAAILRKSGYEATAFYNAQSALAQLEAYCPELVITDVVMPGMSGVEMAVLIRERQPKCKVWLFSGQASNTEVLEQAQIHDFELLTKPLHPRELLAKLQVYVTRQEAT